MRFRKDGFPADLNITSGVFHVLRPLVLNFLFFMESEEKTRKQLHVMQYLWFLTGHQLFAGTIENKLLALALCC